MRFYKNQDHPFYAGVDLHARSMYVSASSTSKTTSSSTQNLPRLIPYSSCKPSSPTATASSSPAECMFAWYYGLPTSAKTSPSPSSSVARYST